MARRDRTASSAAWRTLLPWMERASALVLFAVAFGPFLGLDLARDPEPELERWFFETGGTSPGLALLIAAWLAWRRLPQLRALPVQAAKAATACLAAATVLVFAWAKLAAAPDLLAVSLALLLLAFGCAARGLRGVRCLWLPAALLLLALPIPFPLQNEVVWQLQLWSAAGAESLLELGGFDVSRTGAHLRHGDISFVVIDTCSGLRSMRTLTLVAFVLRELFAGAGPRAWGLVAGAPVLALLLNWLRIAIIATDAARAEAAPADTHLEQGLAVLFAGTLVLFAIGHFLERGRRAASSSAPASLGELPWRSACVGLCALALLSLGVAPWPTPNPKSPVFNAIPLQLADWKGKTVEADLRFLHGIFLGAVQERLYERAGRRAGEGGSVALFVASEVAQSGRTSPSSRALLLPASDWVVESSEPTRIWSLGVDGTLASVRHRDGRALVYGFGLHEGGAIRDSLRSLLALERGPFLRSQARVRLRIATAMGRDPRSRERAKQLLDRFVFDFQRELAAL